MWTKHNDSDLTAAALLAMVIAIGGTARAAEPASDALGHKTSRADQWLQATLFTIYALNDYLNHYCVGVEVSDGVVTLRGEVRDQVEKALALRIAEQVDGVRMIEDHIAVGGDAVDASFESDLHRSIRNVNTTAAVERGLAGDVGTTSLSIAVGTKDGVVTLSGLVQTDSERRQAERIAAETSGVDAVSNRLDISPGEIDTASPAGPVLD
jgi:osmotically-inducible protein OsmY